MEPFLTRLMLQECPHNRACFKARVSAILSDMPEEELSHSHDRIFRHAMSLPLVARQFLETWMPKEFLTLVEWDTLRVENFPAVFRRN